MARYTVSHRILRYWGRIVAYLYRDNYPSNEVDIPHNSQSPSPSMPSMPSETSTKGVLCSVARAGKVTLIGSNCPASRVGPCVDCEGGRTAQIFSDCAITKYLSHATARRPCGRQTIAAMESPQLLLFGSQYSQQPCWITLDFKEHRLPADRRLAGCPRPSPHRNNGEARSDRIVYMYRVSYCIAIFCVKLCRIVSCPLWLYRAITGVEKW